MGNLNNAYFELHQLVWHTLEGGGEIRKYPLELLYYGLAFHIGHGTIHEYNEYLQNQRRTCYALWNSCQRFGGIRPRQNATHFAPAPAPAHAPTHPHPHPHPGSALIWSSAEKLNPDFAPHGMWRLNITFDRITLSITFTANNWTKYAGTAQSLRGRRSISGWDTYLLFAITFRTKSDTHSVSHTMDTGLKAVGE